MLRYFSDLHLEANNISKIISRIKPRTNEICILAGDIYSKKTPDAFFKFINKKKGQLWPFIKTNRPGHRSPGLQIQKDDPPHFHSPRPLRHRPPVSPAGIFAIYRLKSRLI
jgi:hypothetical protein